MKHVKKFLHHVSKKIFTFETFTKTLTFWIIFIALFDVQLSYLLAYLGRSEIAESLSSQMVITILGVSFTYMLRGFFDTYAEKKHDIEISKMAQELGNDCGQETEENNE